VHGRLLLKFRLKYKVGGKSGVFLKKDVERCRYHRMMAGDGADIRFSGFGSRACRGTQAGMCWWSSGKVAGRAVPPIVYSGVERTATVSIVAFSGRNSIFTAAIRKIRQANFLSCSFLIY
jgi:hypothetical protein